MYVGIYLLIDFHYPVSRCEREIKLFDCWIQLPVIVHIIRNCKMIVCKKKPFFPGRKGLAIMIRR